MRKTNLKSSYTCISGCGDGAMNGKLVALIFNKVSLLYVIADFEKNILINKQKTFYLTKLLRLKTKNPNKQGH